MYQNIIYIGISQHSKICWFSVNKRWRQQSWRGVSRDSFIFWIFFRQGITVPSFIIVRYAWHILGRGAFLVSPPSVKIHKMTHPEWGLMYPHYN